jgi:polysaccharide deacetylase family protein (PEP-CTERM system associated)
MRVLTFDIEDWFHVLDHTSTRSESDWGLFPSRIYNNVHRVLDLLERYRTPATFFCLGWIAERYPSLVREIADCGYEIASHSHTHQLAYEQSREEFAKDLDRSIKTLQDVTGQRVRAFRAPGFSLTTENPWVVDVLVEYGIEIDCSIFPVKRSHGGFPEVKASEPVLLLCNNGTLKEFPMSVATILGFRFAFSGGGYFRLLPYPLIRRLSRDTDYMMTYFHPRDFDPGQPLVPGLGLLRRFQSYYGLGSALTKLEWLLGEFDFIDIARADKKMDWSRERVVDLRETITKSAGRIG